MRVRRTTRYLCFYYCCCTTPHPFSGENQVQSSRGDSRQGLRFHTDSWWDYVAVKLRDVEDEKKEFAHTQVEHFFKGRRFSIPMVRRDLKTWVVVQLGTRSAHHNISPLLPYGKSQKEKSQCKESLDCSLFHGSRGKSSFCTGDHTCQVWNIIKLGYACSSRQLSVNVRTPKILLPCLRTELQIKSGATSYAPLPRQK